MEANKPADNSGTAKDAVETIMKKLVDNPSNSEDHLAAVERAMEKLREERKLPPGPGRPATI